LATEPETTAVFSYARPYSRIMYFAGLGMAVEALCLAGFSYLIKPMLERVFIQQEASFTRLLPFIILALFALRGLGVLLGDYLSAVISRRIVCDLRIKVFEHYLHLPSAYFSKQTSGELIARVAHYIEEIGRAATEGFKIVLVDGITIVGFLTVMFLLSPKMTISVFVIGPMVGLLIAAVGRRTRRISSRIQESLADVTQVTQEAIVGERLIKTYGAQQQERERFAVAVGNNLKENLRISWVSALSTALVQWLAAVALAMVIYVATSKQFGTPLSPDRFMAFISAMLGTLPSLKRLTTVQATLQRGSTAVQSMQHVLAEPTEIEVGTKLAPTDISLVRFERVSLRYGDREVDALTNFTASLYKGTITALVGRSGSGKSSLVSLLLGLNEPSQGQVFFNDSDVTTLSRRSRRQRIAYVAQNTILFADSVAKNIAFGELRDASMEKIVAAAKAAQAHEFISSLPDGYQTRLGENGAQLSGGQRQRLAIARAFLKDAPILILDEATSSLDNEAERAIQEALLPLCAGRIVLVVAHRLSTVRHADHIVVLDRGAIVEQGQFSNLVEAGGPFSALYSQVESAP
jgi:ATP-binding cassette, subfamily B, bacterial MsbA